MGKKTARAGLQPTAERRARAVEDALGQYSLDGDNVLTSIEALQELLETDKAVLYTLAQRPDGEDLMLVRTAVVAYPRERLRQGLEEFVRGRGVDWGAYNAVRPEPAQRDRVLQSDEVAIITKGRSLEVEDVLYRALGIWGQDTMRALVCDGPSLLGWVGCVQPDKTTEHQRELLERVLPAFRRRLVFERLVSESAIAGGAMVAALEQVSGAAWVLGSAGGVLHANAAGRGRFDHDANGTRTSLDACVQGAGARRFKVTPLRERGARAGHLVVEVAEPAARAQEVPVAASRLELTPAQTRVLERVARGASNARIAADLGVAERTVEAHVTAILVKAQVPSRAALIVQIFSDHRMA